jgi:hypothetical protein
MNLELAKQIQALTGLTPNERYWKMIDAGREYLDKWAPVRIQVAAALRQSEAFWQWWAGIWEMRDQRIVNMLMQEQPSMELVAWIDMRTGKPYPEFYANYHSPARLPYHPNQVIQGLAMYKGSKRRNAQAV